MAVNSGAVRKFANSLTALATTVGLTLISAIPASAAEQDISIRISNISSQIDPVTSKTIATISGEVSNAGVTDVKNLEIVLTSGSKITNRENLHNFLLKKSNPKFQNTKNSAKLNTVRGSTKYNWQITFVVEDIFSTPNGIYEIGVTAKTDEPISTDRAVLPAISPASSSLITAVIGIQLSTLNSHLASGGQVATDEGELDRLLSLVLNNSDLPVSWIVDPEVRQWATELLQTDLVEKATALLASLDAIASNSTPTIYSQPDLARVLTSNRADDLTNLAVRTNQMSGTDKIVIAPSDGRTTNAAIRKLNELGVRPILSNKFVAGKEFKTTELNSSVGEVPSLVTDSGLLSCLTTESIKGFDQRNCLLGDLGVIATEAPANVLITTPLTWNPGADEVRNIVSYLQNKPWLSITSLNQVLNTAPTNALKMPADFEVDPFSSALLKSGDAISTSSAKTSSLFLDASYSDAFFLARLRGYSALWATGDLATEFLNINEELLTSYQEAISIDASRNITVSNTSTQIPITVVNTSDRDVSVVVQLKSPQVSRFSSTPSQVITVPSGKRVTVPMDITLTGKGIVNVNATLYAPNGLSIGKPKLIQISSAEYQGFARTLVIVAFGLLVLLSISNIYRRRRGTDRG